MAKPEIIVDIEQLQFDVDNISFDSVALTGIPTSPTAAAGTSTTQVATTEFVQNEIGPKTWGLLNGTYTWGSLI